MVTSDVLGQLMQQGNPPWLSDIRRTDRSWLTLKIKNPLAPLSEREAKGLV